MARKDDVYAFISKAAGEEFVNSQLAAEFGVSGPTMRRDLTKLVENGQVVERVEKEGPIKKKFYSVPAQEEDVKKTKKTKRAKKTKAKAKKGNDAVAVEQILDFARQAVVPVLEKSVQGLTAASLGSRTNLTSEAAEKTLEMLTEAGDVVVVSTTRTGTKRYGVVQEKKETEPEPEPTEEETLEDIVEDLDKLLDTLGSSTLAASTLAARMGGMNQNYIIKLGEVLTQQGRIEKVGETKSGVPRFKAVTDEADDEVEVEAKVEPKKKAKKKAKTKKTVGRKAKRAAAQAEANKAGVRRLVGGEEYVFASDPDDWLPKVCPTPDCEDRPVASTLEEVGAKFGFRTPAGKNTIPQGPCKKCRQKASRASQRKKRKNA